MGKYGLSGRLVEYFSCSKSFLSAVQQAMVWAIFKNTESEWLHPQTELHKQHSSPGNTSMLGPPIEVSHHFRKSNKLLLWIQILTLPL